MPPKISAALSSLPPRFPTIGILTSPLFLFSSRRSLLKVIRVETKLRLLVKLACVLPHHARNVNCRLMELCRQPLLLSRIRRFRSGHSRSGTHLVSKVEREFRANSS